MISLLGRALCTPEIQLSLTGRLARSIVRKTQGSVGYGLRFRERLQASERPHYLYCMLNAADLARKLGLKRIAALEFGVAGGNGIRVMTQLAAEIERETGVAIECYGFDTGQGMPPPEEARDLPYWFKEAQYCMDVDALRKAVPEAKLMLGPIDSTIDAFCSEQTPPPVGCMFFDMDYYSSTRDSFRLFEQSKKFPDCFMPRIFTYFDDVLGSEVEMYCAANGQLAAIHDFNASHDDMQIHLNQNLLPVRYITYSHKIYYVHLFGHPRYNEYIGGSEQVEMEQRLKIS
ncbi:MAG: hypothetical protein AAF677_00065 [Pseudomonadota bacterium]